MAESSVPQPVDHSVRIPRTSELVATALRAQIVRGELSENSNLPPEVDLMAMFHVSRPTLREAYRVLESEGLLTVRRGTHGGARVHVPNSDAAARFAGLVLQYQNVTIADVLEARTVLEPPAAGSLAANHTDEDLVALNEHLDADERRLGGPASVVPFHTDFHERMVERSGNQTISMLTDLLRHMVNSANLAHRATLPSRPDELRKDRAAVKAHRRLIEYIQAGDADGAEAFWLRHVVESNRLLLAKLGEATVLDLLG